MQQTDGKRPQAHHLALTGNGHLDEDAGWSKDVLLKQ